MRHSSPSKQKPAGASILRRACWETGIPLPGLVTTGTATKVEMKTWQADVRTTTAAVAGAMTRVVTAAVTGTRPVRLVTTVAGVVAAAMARSIRLVAAMPRAVVTGAATVAGAMTGTVSAPMTGAAGGMMITRQRSSRSEDSETGSDSQESNELFHIELGLIRCRILAACESDAEPA